MGMIGQKGKRAWGVSRRSLAVSLAAVLATACASTQFTGPGAPAGPGGPPRPFPAAQGPAAEGSAAGRPAPQGPLSLSAHVRRLAAFQRWGLAQPTRLPPRPPAVKPELVSAATKAGPGLPPVIHRIPTDERVVFLTIDDGAEKDPRFLRLLDDLDVPVTAFLTDYVSRDDYGYFRRLRSLGGGIHNHTVNHRNLPALSYAGQHGEICGQQRNLEREFGAAPRLFRPPYGNYDRATLRAAGDCGIDVVVLWSLEAWADRIDYQAADRRLRPGDIILSHFRGPREWNGTMNDMTRQVLRAAARQGFAVARLEDYL
ncbi:polysaccharide deacetylase family protein [Streptomyces capparidis]